MILEEGYLRTWQAQKRVLESDTTLSESYQRLSTDWVVLRKVH